MCRDRAQSGRHPGDAVYLEIEEAGFAAAARPIATQGRSYRGCVCLEVFGHKDKTPTCMRR